MTREIADFLQSGLIEIAGESLKPADVPHPASKNGWYFRDSFINLI